ncbi:hypothetical protein A3753_15660 [Sulfitobacter sp. HI0082]|jgi:hypothetical protein|nr:hypothetical protein A3753_15660 [Sulfitobacter sp. HI0082]
MKEKGNKFEWGLGQRSGGGKSNSGEEDDLPFEVIEEGNAMVASGTVVESATGSTHVTVRYREARLTIEATYQPKRRGPIEASFSLPLDFSEPSYLFPLLEGERPWSDWVPIERFVRETMEAMPIPPSEIEILKRHLRVLRAVRNGPEVSKLLSARPEKLRQDALSGVDDEQVASQLAVIIEGLQRNINHPKVPLETLAAAGNFIRMYEEFFRERQRRDAMSAYDRMGEKIFLKEMVKTRHRPYRR